MSKACDKMAEQQDTISDLLEALEGAKLQIIYLHEKFKETGSGNGELAKIDAAIAKAKGL
jgi:hypothetical protein